MFKVYRSDTQLTIAMRSLNAFQQDILLGPLCFLEFLWKKQSRG